MRDAFGATHYISFALVFIAVFASMLAISLNYTKAFRIKNQIINYIEVNNGLSESLKSDIDSYVTKMDYYITNFNPGSSSYRSEFQNECNKRGYCIYKITAYDKYTKEIKGAYYKVVTYLHFEFMFFDVHVDVPLTGETKLVTENYVK